MLHAAAKGECSMWHSGQGRMTLAVGHGPEGEFFPETVLDSLFAADLIDSERDERHLTHFHIRITGAGRAELERRS